MKDPHHINRVRLFNCMKKKEHLISALQHGLQLNPHAVRLPFDVETLRELPDKVRHKIESELVVDKSVPSSEDRHIVVRVPMACFSEVLGKRGRTIRKHLLNFGSFGLFVSIHWLQRHGGDRVVYTGGAFGARLNRLFLSSFYGDDERKNADRFNMWLDLISMTELGWHLQEQEWRIARPPISAVPFEGDETGELLSIKIADIEGVFVRSGTEISEIHELLEQKADKEAWRDPLPQVWSITEEFLNTGLPPGVADQQ